ncbi:hypothetical protein HOLleu_21118 [Holothuria leucospilota]|uniref:Uncharacterized protein n=1 Tax=Holothuria leucospilota TaxID=206669 RepID=A0A9Q1H3T5_HOLLE|nr:hypothetical protein HOLleu_21118 [Holothuria leucospilota]
MAKTCNFRGFLDEALRDSYILGLNDENPQKRLLGEDDSLSPEKAFKLAVGMETAKLNYRSGAERQFCKHGISGREMLHVW